MANDVVNLSEAARDLGIAPSSVLRWIERLDIHTVTLPDGRRLIRASDVDQIRQARDGNSIAQATSAGMRRHHDRRRSNAQ